MRWLLVWLVTIHHIAVLRGARGKYYLQSPTITRDRPISTCSFVWHYISTWTTPVAQLRILWTIVISNFPSVHSEIEAQINQEFEKPGELSPGTILNLIESRTQMLSSLGSDASTTDPIKHPPFDPLITTISRICSPENPYSDTTWAIICCSRTSSSIVVVVDAVVVVGWRPNFRRCTPWVLYAVVAVFVGK